MVLFSTLDNLTMPPLTALEIRQEATRRTDKTRTLSDGNGLNLIVPASGANGNPRWVLRFAKNGKPSMRGLGRYPEVSLLDARKAALQLRAQIQTSGPPLTAQQQRASEQATEHAQSVTFAVAARRWFDATSEHLTPKHRAQVISSLTRHAFPTLGKKPLGSIRPGDIENVMRRMMAPSNPLMETASRVFQRINAVFEYAGRQEWCTNNPASVLRGELTRLKKQIRRHNPEGHHAAMLDDADIAAVLKAISTYSAQQTRAALEAIIYTGCRSGELRQATWAEIDFDNARWTIPAAHMKARREHVIPLSPQALARFRELKTYAGRNALVVPGNRRRTPISDMTLSMSLRRMGFDGLQTVHGFRAWLSTKAREYGQFPRDVVEAALAHTVSQDATEAAYLRSNFLEQRVGLMTWWGSWIDAQRERQLPEVVAA